MKTLVLQLARLGDIYQSWPVLRALKRAAAPGDEIHFLAREKFAAATEGLEAIDRNWTLATRSILEPLVQDTADIDAALAKLDEFVNGLREQKFDRVINLSFSPFSSRLVHAIAPAGCEVRGYARHEDGFLSIPDDASAYFFAQVGPHRHNRMHLTDLFAQVSGVELIEDDWVSPARIASEPSSMETSVFAAINGVQAPIVIHLGASDVTKTYSAGKWLSVVAGLIERADAPVVLIGSKDERGLAALVTSSARGHEAIDLVGKTRLRDLFDLIGRAQLLIGGDSAPVHIAALTGTKVLNLSFRTVSFWETGPRSPGSRILPFETPDDLASDVVVSEALAMLENRAGDARAVHVVSRLDSYVAPPELATSAGWEWLMAIYMGQPFPVAESELCVQGLMRLHEVNDLALTQLETLARRTGDKTALGILDRFDEIIEMIAGMVPTLGILVRWFQTERVRLGPMPGEELLDRTRKLHEKLQDVLALYMTSPAVVEGDEAHDDIHMG